VLELSKLLDSKSLPASSSLDSPSIASSSTDVISVTASSTNQQQGSNNLDSSNTDRSIPVKEDLSDFSVENSCLPNILNPNEDFSHVISISNVSTPQDRFAMVGGMTGFLSDMKRNGVQCNVKTFDQMLSLISPDCD
jgi:pentatricopeptide repeat domain-containing protein 1